MRWTTCTEAERGIDCTRAPNLLLLLLLLLSLLLGLGVVCASARSYLSHRLSLFLSLSLGCGAHIMVVRDALSLLNLERDTVPALAPSAPSRGGKQEEKDGWVVSNVVRRRVDCLTARSFVRRAGCPEILQSVHMRRGENEPSAALHARTSRLPRFSASSRVFCMRLNTTYTRIRNSM